MKCQFPDCNRQATVHLTELADSGKKEIHLCEQHAAEMGVPGQKYFSATDLLAGIAKAQQGTQKDLESGTKCPHCGMTLSRFQASGRFGCARCYETFEEEIAPLVERIHDSAQHVGKVPPRVPAKAALTVEARRIQLELNKTVKQEDYEKAAGLRDRLKKIESELAGKK
ncbi:MAG: hypothetical protein AMXMBFR7_25730 [Planctomycetota bacterium]